MASTVSLDIFAKRVYNWRQQLLAYLQGPIVIKPYTVATLPDPATYENCIIYVSNGTSNKRLAVSDGTQWRWPDGNIVT